MEIKPVEKLTAGAPGAATVLVAAVSGRTRFVRYLKLTVLAAVAGKTFWVQDSDGTKIEGTSLTLAAVHDIDINFPSPGIPATNGKGLSAHADEGSFSAVVGWD